MPLRSRGVQCTCRPGCKDASVQTAVQTSSVLREHYNLTWARSHADFLFRIFAAHCMPCFSELRFLDHINNKPFEIYFSICFKGLAVTWNNMFAVFHLGVKLCSNEETYIDLMLVFILLGLPSPSALSGPEHPQHDTSAGCCLPQLPALLPFRSSWPLCSLWSFFTFLKEAVLFLPALKSNMQKYSNIKMVEGFSEKISI